MTRETFTIAAVAFLCSAEAISQPVTFQSPCECRDAHGKARVSLKKRSSASLLLTHFAFDKQLHRAHCGLTISTLPVQRSHRMGIPPYVRN
jgi:hypothetical protein